MSDDEECIEEKIEAILEWADKHPSFDTSFVESLQEQYEETESLSYKQIESLNNIIERFGIDW